MQSKVFLEGEGNRYFSRCQIREKCEDGTNPAAQDLASKLMEMYQLEPASVLDIGCSNGFRLEGLRTSLGAEGYGLEPGIDAINDGRSRFPHLNLKQGVCSNIPWERTFDLVIINFVLHWVERESVGQCIDEIDRVLDSGGLLILGDFFPDTSTENEYHHLPDRIRTFKEHYFEHFTKRGYTHLAHLSSHHDRIKTLEVCSDPAQRVVVSLLQKR